MANQTCLQGVFYIQGDGASLTAKIAIKTTPMLLNNFSSAASGEMVVATPLLYNFPAPIDNVEIVSARDSFGVDFSPTIGVSKSGYLITLTFAAAFSDLRIIQLRINFDI